MTIVKVDVSITQILLVKDRSIRKRWLRESERYSIFEELDESGYSLWKAQQGRFKHTNSCLRRVGKTPVSVSACRAE